MAEPRTIRRRMKTELGKVAGEQEKWGQLSLAELQEALAGITQGYDRSIGEVGKQFGAQRQGIRDREAQTYGKLSQGLAQRGLGNTTVGANLQRGLASDTNRQYQQAAAGEASMLGNLFTRQGQAQANQRNIIANLYGQRSDQATKLGMARKDLMQLTNEEDNWGGMLGSIGGGLLGANFGMPGLGSSLGGMLGGGLSGQSGGYGGYANMFGQSLGKGELGEGWLSKLFE